MNENRSRFDGDDYNKGIIKSNGIMAWMRVIEFTNPWDRLDLRKEKKRDWLTREKGEKREKP